MSEREVPYRPGEKYGQEHALISDVRKTVETAWGQLERTLDRIEDEQDTLAPEAVTSRRRKIAESLRNAADELDPRE